MIKEMSKNIINAAAVILLLSGCRSHREAPIARVDDIQKPVPSAGKAPNVPARALPHVRIYRMKGDYANYVPITLNEDGTQLMSYPAVTDIYPSAKPEYLIDGWYLDHRGVNVNTAFTSYTYDEYSKLPKTPTQSDLMSHIIAKKAIAEILDLGVERIPNDSIIRLIQNLPSSQNK